MTSTSSEERLRAALDELADTTTISPYAWDVTISRRVPRRSRPFHALIAAAALSMAIAGLIVVAVALRNGSEDGVLTQPATPSAQQQPDSIPVSEVTPDLVESSPPLDPALIAKLDAQFAESQIFYDPAQPEASCADMVAKAKWVDAAPDSMTIPLGPVTWANDGSGTGTVAGPLVTGSSEELCVAFFNREAMCRASTWC